MPKLRASRSIAALAAPWLSLATLLSGCAAPARLRVAMDLLPGQEALYKTRILKPFEKKHKCLVEIVPAPDPAKLPDLLAAGDTVDLVAAPLAMTRALAGRNLIAPLDAVAGPKDLADARKEFFLTDLGAVGGRTYFLPRSIETPVIVYLKSKVAEAVQYWGIRRDEINRALARYNGRGLPRGYVLEKDPSRWDWFDLFVAGWYWAAKEVQGQKRGRLALGPPGSPGFPQSLMDACFLSGAGPDGILGMNDAGVADMFQWQSVLAREGILSPLLLKERWSDAQVREGFRSGELYLSVARQTEAFQIHGTGSADLPGYLADPEDMGVALMPKGGSLLLNPDGDPLREGRRSAATRSQWWGVTLRARDPKLAYELARYLADTENQVQESAAFGLVPVRQDLLGELGLMFGGGWTAEVFQTASQQLVENRLTTAPLVEEFPAVARNYQAAYEDICLPGPGQKTRYEDVRKALEERWVPRQRQILGNKYPVKSLSVR
jgi:ABC-type glycerol-3-phosphate transport system substrate-binding protein